MPINPIYAPRSLYHRVDNMHCTSCVERVETQAKMVVHGWQQANNIHNAIESIQVCLVSAYLEIRFNVDVPADAQRQLSAMLMKKIEKSFDIMHISPPHALREPEPIYNRRFFRRLLVAALAMIIGIPWLAVCLCMLLPSPFTGVGYALRVSMLILAVGLFLLIGLPIMKKTWKAIRKWQLGMQTINCLSMTIALLYSSFIVLMPHTAVKWGFGTHTLLGCFFLTLGALTLSALIKQVMKSKIRWAHYRHAQQLLQRKAVLDPNSLSFNTYVTVRDHAPVLQEKTALPQLLTDTGFVLLPDQPVPVSSRLDTRCHQPTPIQMDRYPETGHHHIDTLQTPNTHIFTAGCINKTGAPLYLISQKTGKEGKHYQRFKKWQISLQSLFSQRADAPTLSPRLSHWLTVIIVLSSILTFLCWLYIGHVSAFTALGFGLSVLLNCPCHFLLALTLPHYAEKLRLLKSGILPQSRTMPLPDPQRCVFVFDKTNTLDTLSLNVSDTTHALIELVYPLERWIKDKEGETNPYANLICQWAEQHHATTPVSTAQDVEYKSHGISGRVQDATIHIGNLEWISKQLGPDARLPAHLNETQPHMGTEETTLHVLRNNTYAGALHFSAQLKPGTGALFAHLRREALPVYILSGSDRAAVTHLGQQLNIEETHLAWEKTRQEKEAFIQDLKQRPAYQGRHCVMIGDGVNDELAMKASDIPIAVSPPQSPSPIPDAHFIIPEPAALLTVLQARTHMHWVRGLALTMSALLFIFNFFCGSGLCTLCFHLTLPPAFFGLTMAAATVVIYGLVFLPLLITKQSTPDPTASHIVAATPLPPSSASLHLPTNMSYSVEQTRCDPHTHSQVRNTV